MKKDLFSMFDETDDFSYIDTPTVYVKHKLKKLGKILKKNNAFEGINYEEKD